MRALPLGVPKLMVSTVASRDMSDLIGTKDITVMHSVIDILGLNPIGKKIMAAVPEKSIGLCRRDKGNFSAQIAAMVNRGNKHGGYAGSHRQDFPTDHGVQQRALP
jgi:uncharacterized protein (UPF0261 family)